jgi:hypothetical protein
MHICALHWDKLRAAIKERGIDHLVARSGKEVIDAAVEELQGGDPSFDPLMSCNYMIWNQGLKMGGLYLMGQKSDGSEYCPICEALVHMAPPPGMTKEQQERSWIDGPADMALDECRKRGLVPVKQ